MWQQLPDYQKQDIVVGSLVGITTGKVPHRSISTLVPKSGVRRLLGAVHDDYWSFSKGISIEEARVVAKAEGFGLEIGRVSRFENARDAVIIGRGKLKDRLVNKIELAEEIEHGLDRATHEATRFLRRNAGLSAERLNKLFHIELFERIIKNWEAGKFQFLSTGDIASIRKIIEELK